MKSANPAHSGVRDTPGARPTDTRPGKTPNADMQPEDTGSEASGTDDVATDSATAATRAMKQTSKTATESGGRR